jgi:hypothetical protein
VITTAENELKKYFGTLELKEYWKCTIENENRSTSTYQARSLCIHSYISPLASHLMMNSYVFVDLIRIEPQRFIIGRHEDFDVIDTSTCRNMLG